MKQTDSLLPVPTGALIIPETPYASEETGKPPILLSLIIPTYNEVKNVYIVFNRT